MYERNDERDSMDEIHNKKLKYETEKVGKGKALGGYKAS